MTTYQAQIDHQSLAWHLANNPELEEIVSKLSDAEIESLIYDWSFWAREKQLMPDLSEWVIWLILAGRGWGKTLTGAETVRQLVEANLIRNIAFVAPTAADARDVMVDELRQASGILAISKPDFMPKYEPSKRRVVWPNGAVARLFSAEDPDALRGPQHDFAWCDEIAAWPRLNIDLTWSNLMMGLRKGISRVLVTTTPRPIQLLKTLIARPTTFITKGSTYENIQNLSDVFINENIAPYVGTRLGRQELDAEILDDNPDAQWTYGLLDANRIAIAPENLSEVVVAIDPAGAIEGHEVGIVVAGRHLNLKEGYLLADHSGHYTPADWAKKAIDLYDLYDADCIVVERNYGGDMVASTVRLVAQTIGHSPVRIIEVIATRGKVVRAEPIVGLDEQHHIHIVGSFKTLEDQLVNFSLGTSNDRVDAYVWAFTHLLGNAIPRLATPDPEAFNNYLSEVRKRPRIAQTSVGNVWRKQF